MDIGLNVEVIRGLFGLGFADSSFLLDSHSQSQSRWYYLCWWGGRAHALCYHTCLSLSERYLIVNVREKATLQTPSHAMLTRVSFQFPYFPWVPFPFPFQTQLIRPSFVYQPSNKSLAICNTKSFTHTLLLFYHYSILYIFDIQIPHPLHFKNKILILRISSVTL